MPRYLTKSRFKLATECETKLFYTRKDEYADQSMEDEFLQALAEGGYQVGELAKFHFVDQPQKEGITVESKGYEKPLEETRQMIDAGQTIIAEAAVKYENLFIRVDIFQIDTSKKEIHFYEVKAKSISQDESFGNAKQTNLTSKWKPYLYDAAFQKYVITKAYPDYKVYAHLMLVDKDSKTTVDGLNQMFTIYKNNGGFTVSLPGDLHRDDLGDDVLTIINVDQETDWIWNHSTDSLLYPYLNFIYYIHHVADSYKRDEKLKTPISKACKDCQFYTKPEDEAAGKKSGFKKCWMEKAGLREEDFSEALVTNLWGGKSGNKSHVQIEIDNNKRKLTDIDPREFASIPTTEDPEIEKEQRRAIQIHKEKTGDRTPILLPSLKQEMEQWEYPLHFIDFETCAPALPFRKDQHPYEGIAFQYSHHTVDADGTIKHAGQFLHTTQGEDPNIEFIRSLKNELDKDPGTIFRYHNHENTYLVKIYFQLEEMSQAQVPDKKELQGFIHSITQMSDKKANELGVTPWEGERNMVDMWNLVLRYYYSPHTRGSNSIKAVLPAVIHDSEYIKQKYSQPVYGKDHPIKSLNFDEHIWIQEDKDNDPYKTLPPVFEEYDEDQLDSLVDDLDNIAHGGAAMIAYQKLQFSSVPGDQREHIRQALLKYCELDTMAMVMIWEYWNTILQKQKNNT